MRVDFKTKECAWGLHAIMHPISLRIRSTSQITSRSIGVRIVSLFNTSIGQMGEYFDIFRQDPYFNWIDIFNVNFKGLENAQLLDDTLSLLEKQ